MTEETAQTPLSRAMDLLTDRLREQYHETDGPRYKVRSVREAQDGSFYIRVYWSDRDTAETYEVYPETGYIRPVPLTLSQGGKP